MPAVESGPRHLVGDFIDDAGFLGCDLNGVGILVRAQSVQLVQPFQD
jgi:hypothetical protein